jgi:hypothetical protein
VADGPHPAQDGPTTKTAAFCPKREVLRGKVRK